MRKLLKSIGVSVVALVAGLNTYLASGAASAAQSKVSDLTLEAMGWDRVYYEVEDGRVVIHVVTGHPGCTEYYCSDCDATNPYKCTITRNEGTIYALEVEGTGAHSDYTIYR